MTTHLLDTVSQYLLSVSERLADDVSTDDAGAAVGAAVGGLEGRRGAEGRAVTVRAATADAARQARLGHMHHGGNNQATAADVRAAGPVQVALLEGGAGSAGAGDHQMAAARADVVNALKSRGNCQHVGNTSASKSHGIISV